jgi:hypothetical protein
MKSTGSYSEHEEVENNPEKPFLKDLAKDIAQIDFNYSKHVAMEVKKKMISYLLGSI